MNTSAQTPTQRRAPGWFLVAASVAGIGLVLFQMSKQNIPTLRPDPSPPVVEPTPTLWTPRMGSPAVQTASAPTLPAPRAPLPTERVRSALQAWAEAWRERNVERYLSFYDEDFPNRDAFARQKQRVMGRAEFIEVKINQLRLTPLGNGQTEARFLQTYRSNSFENQALKRQLWQEGPNGRLQIVEESS